MARKTQSELLDDILENLPDNQTGGITASAIRTILTDVVDTSFAEDGDISVVPQAGVPWAEDISEGFATLALAVAAHAGELVHWLIDEAWIVDADLMIPEEVTLLFTPTGHITVEAGNALTIDGQLKCGAHDHLFTADGSTYGRVMFGRKCPRDVFPQWWGAVPDNATDCWAAITQAIHCRDTGTNHGVNVRITAGRFYCSKTIEINAYSNLVGTHIGFSNISDEVPTITFAPNTTGIIVHQVAGSPEAGGRGDWVIIQNLYLQPKVPNQYWGYYGGEYDGDDSWKDSAPNHLGEGIFGAARAKIADCRIIGFGGHGIEFNSTKLGTNCNNWMVIRCRAQQCGGAGLYTRGADANAGISILAEGSTCRWGLYEASFLGNVHIGYMEELSQMAVCKVEGGANYSTLIGCYVEGEPPGVYPEFEGRSIVIGGSLSIWAGLSAQPCNRVLSNYGYSRGIGDSFYQHTSNLWSRTTIPGWVDGNLFIKDEADGAVFATLTLEVTAGASGATIARHTRFTHDPANTYPLQADNIRGTQVGPSLINFYAEEPHTLTAFETKQIQVYSGYPAPLFNNIDAGLIDRLAIANADITSVVQIGTSSGAADGTAHYSLRYDTHPEGYNTDPARLGGVWTRGKFLLNSNNTVPHVFFWTGRDDLYQDRAQFAPYVAFADSPAMITQRLEVSSLADGAEHTFEFNGAPQWGLAFFNAKTENMFTATTDVRADVDDVVEVRRWFDDATDKFKVKIRNSSGGLANVSCSAVFMRRAIYKGGVQSEDYTLPSYP